jgi:hypothetical protein
MPIDRFSQSIRVTAPAQRIYDHLIDPTNHIGLSPLIVAVRDVHPVGDATGYVAVERFRFGPFRWDNLIRVTVTGVARNHRIVSDVVSPGAVRLTATVDLNPDDDGTTGATRRTRPPVQPLSGDPAAYEESTSAGGACETVEVPTPTADGTIIWAQPMLLMGSAAHPELIARRRWQFTTETSEAHAGRLPGMGPAHPRRVLTVMNRLAAYDS